ncbi:hypothetical protein E2562_022989 [Oryza meyeriana var. granulata]|uniref:Uncharacterized protein n=1 Tax=Oryza meyeriana var. granulata TaxID=110450 RepID=A0A6G1EYE6_9ORYZ|nr:hypothetical protein E2562_022989 [Oryza meyeriana var. granulata]
MDTKNSSSSSISAVVPLCLQITVISILMFQAQQLGGADLQRQVPAVYVLRDSTLDVGNNNYLPGKDVFRANRPYNGIDYPGSKPTGRFSNGYNLADFVGFAS